MVQTEQTTRAEQMGGGGVDAVRDKHQQLLSSLFMCDSMIFRCNKVYRASGMVQGLTVCSIYRSCN